MRRPSPAGRVEPGETFVAGARRETIEESGVDPELTGLLRIEHTPHPDGTQVRLFFVAEAGDQVARDTENEHTLRAGFFTIDEIEELSLRGRDAMDAIRAVSEGAATGPVSMLTREGAPC